MQELAMKSAYSETITRNAKVEYNLSGVTNRFVMIFAKDCNYKN